MIWERDWVPTTERFSRHTNNLNTLLVIQGCFIYVVALLLKGKKRTTNTFYEKGCRKKAPKCTRQDRKVVWIFTGMLRISIEEMYKIIQVCIFEREEFVFPLRRPISVALLLLSHVFELGKFF